MSRMTRQLRTRETFMCGHERETTELVPIRSLRRTAPDIYEQLPRRYPCERCMPLFAKELKLREMGITEHSISGGSQWAAKLDEIDNDPLFSDGSLFFPATGQTLTPNLQHVDPTTSVTTQSSTLKELQPPKKGRVPSLGLQKATENLIENLQRAAPQKIKICDNIKEMDATLARRNRENEKTIDDYLKRVDKQNGNEKWRSIGRRPKAPKY